MNHKDFAIKLARQAGKIIRSNFGIGMKKEWKQDNTPVTVTDKRINRLVIQSVKRYFPSHDVLGEEKSYRPNNSEYLWVCDPVDGTMPFSHGVPTCMFSLALVKNGKPIVGVIYDSFIDRLIFAEKGKGSFLNGIRTHVSKQSLGQHTLIAVPLWRNPMAVDPGRLVNMIHQADSKTFDVGSVVYEGMLVAVGDIAAALFTAKSSHDIAALKVIVEEAGGKVTDLFGSEQPYDRQIKGAIVSNGVTHNDLIKILKKSFIG